DSVEVTELGKKMLNIVSIGQRGRVNNYISGGDTKSINGMIFSFNNPIDGSVQLTERNNNLYIDLPVEGQYMSMLGQQKGVVTDSLLLARQSGTIKAKESTMLNHRTLYGVNGVNFIIPNSIFKGKRVYYKGDKTEPMDKNLLDVVQIELESGNIKDTLFIKGGKGVTGYSETTQINGLNVSIGFGSKILSTDFSIRCDDFILDRYPGSNNPSSYESKITIIDSGPEKQHHIYMNNVMDYRGYRFFQASYFPDESGTILSVNADKWGTNITYFGYFLLFTGMFFTLFWKGTHFWKLNSSLKEIYRKSLILVPLLLFFGLGFGIDLSFAQNSNPKIKDSTAFSQQEIEPYAQFARPDEVGSNR